MWCWFSCCSIAQSCLTLWDPMDCSMPGFPVLHHLPEFVQTHVHWVVDVIQTSHPVISFSSCLLSFPVSGSFPMSRLFASSDQSVRVSTSASVITMNIQSWFPLGLADLISLLSKGISRVFSNTIVQKHQFFDAHLCYIYEMTDVQSTSCWNHFIMYVGQITVLYTLTLL